MEAAEHRPADAKDSSFLFAKKKKNGFKGSTADQAHLAGENPIEVISFSNPCPACRVCDGQGSRLPRDRTDAFY